MSAVNKLREAAEAALTLLDEVAQSSGVDALVGWAWRQDAQPIANRLRAALADLADAEWADEKDNRRDEHQCEGAACCDPGDSQWPQGRPGREHK